MSKPANDQQAESIRHRLRNLLRKRNEDMQFGLQRYAIERFLYRLGVSSYRESFVLKGASLFALWGGSVYRPTRDLDFTGYGIADEADVLAALREICMLSPADALIFDPDTLNAEPIRDDSEYHGLRIRLAAIRGRRAFQSRSTLASAMQLSRPHNTLIIRPCSTIPSRAFAPIPPKR